ncbi:putative transmembrane protein [Helianthus annuus]|nr:putative transmembrane protein [Helianthus annuus]
MALDDILPCVDNATAQETSERTKEVTSQLVNVINQVITNVTNINFAPNFTPLFFNQSGPKMPLLCNPFKPDFTDRTCDPTEVSLSNATHVFVIISNTLAIVNPTRYNKFFIGCSCTINLFVKFHRVGSTPPRAA